MMCQLALKTEQVAGWNEFQLQTLLKVIFKESAQGFCAIRYRFFVGVESERS
jgi:hypothetical protein